MPVFEKIKPKKKFSFNIEEDALERINEILQMAKERDDIKVNLDEALQKDVLRHMKNLREAIELPDLKTPENGVSLVEVGPKTGMTASNGKG